MRLIDSLTDNGTQVLAMVSDDGVSLSLTLRFMPAIQRWAMDITSDNINVSNIIITNHPNLLWSFADLDTFGIACVSNDDVEPFQVDDFLTARSELYLLNAADLASATAFVQGYPAP